MVSEKLLIAYDDRDTHYMLTLISKYSIDKSSVVSSRRIIKFGSVFVMYHRTLKCPDNSIISSAIEKQKCLKLVTSVSFIEWLVWNEYSINIRMSISPSVTQLYL